MRPPCRYPSRRDGHPGVLNLAHRESQARPEPLTPNEPVDICLDLDACGYRLAPGHRIRLALSTAYWPTILPAPGNAALTLDLASLRLGLPLLGEHERIAMPEPAEPDPLPGYESLEPARTERVVERDLAAGVTRYRTLEDTGLKRHPGNGLAWRDVQEECWSIAPDDPLSATGRCRWTCVTRRDGWDTRTLATSTLSCTEREWIITAEVEAFENGRSIFARRRQERILRDMM